VSRLAVAYRVLAWVVGLNLLVVFAGFFGKILTDEGSWWNRNQDTFLVIDQVHGFLFMVLLVIIAVLASRHRWTPAFTITTMLLATVPFVSFWAERRATRVLRAEHAPR
jgi:integral membrane protein